MVELRSIRELRELFPNGTTDNRWLFLSTGGAHGTNLTLDDVEQIIKDQHPLTKSHNDRYWITALVLEPAAVEVETYIIPSLTFAEVLIGMDDINWLRGVVRSTLKSVKESQEGNC